MKTQYLRPVKKGLATVEGRFIKKGRTLSFMESRLWGSDGKLAAVATATWKMPS
jgi:acyl-coenzyme A thioesterase PaaI-like protein